MDPNRRVEAAVKVRHLVETAGVGNFNNLEIIVAPVRRGPALCSSSWLANRRGLESPTNYSKIGLWRRNHERFRQPDDQSGKNGWITLRQAVSNVSAFLLRNRIVFVLTIIFCVATAGTLWHLSRLSWQLIESSALQAASQYADSLKELRKLYTSEVTDRLVGHGIQVTHDYATKEGAIPLPATFSMELSERISQQSTGMHARLYSDFPFPWRKDGGPRDDFEKEAIRQVRQFPDRPFYRFEDFQGRQSLRYAVADQKMTAGCVSCHNTHPDSPKTDWKLGDVRGVLEITRPLDSLIAQTHAGLRETFALDGDNRHTGAVRSGAGNRPAASKPGSANGEGSSGRSGSTEVGFPGQHEPRDPHADERHHWSISPRR